MSRLSTGLSSDERKEGKPSGGNLVSVEETCRVLGISRSEYYRLSRGTAKIARDPNFPAVYFITTRPMHDSLEVQQYKESKRGLDKPSARGTA
jgi:hypothetical protein